MGFSRGKFFDVIVGIALVLTLVFLIVSCFSQDDAYLWLALIFGGITFVAGIIRYLRLGKND